MTTDTLGLDLAIAPVTGRARSPVHPRPWPVQFTHGQDPFILYQPGHVAAHTRRVYEPATARFKTARRTGSVMARMTSPRRENARVDVWLIGGTGGTIPRQRPDSTAGDWTGPRQAGRRSEMTRLARGTFQRQREFL